MGKRKHTSDLAIIHSRRKEVFACVNKIRRKFVSTEKVWEAFVRK